MRVEDLTKTYQSRSDEELVDLALAPEHLTTEARLALESELSRRRLSTAERLHSERRTALQVTDELIGFDKTVQPTLKSVGEFMATVIRAYHTHFWLWFKIAAPAVIISTTAIILGRNQTQEILRHLPRVYGLPDVHQFEIAKIWLIQLVAGLVSWIASALSFGATCMAMREIESGTIPAPSDCFAAVLRRLSPFVRLSLILYFFGWVVAVAGFWAEPALVWLLRHQSHFSVDLRIVWLISFASMAFFFLVLSRFALAIPALVLDNYGVAQAMFRSDEVTEGKWIVLAAILAKSTIGGYVAAMSPFWLAQWIIPPSLALRSWFPWVLTVASMVGVSAVEPTMFVGFVSLYLRTSPFVPRQTHLVNRQLA